MSSPNKQIKKPLYYRFIKRTFDIVFSALCLVLGLIPSIIVCLIIFCKDGHSPFYKERRIVKPDKEICIYKFRSMVVDSDNHKKYFSKEQEEEWQREHKVVNDPRVLGRLGRFLRNSSIDEFPQFIHVFSGKMSTIGPRIITKEELKFFPDNVEKLLSIKPGISGLWQTSKRPRPTYETNKRQECELYYVKSASLPLDIKIFFRTISVIWLGIIKRNK